MLLRADIDLHETRFAEAAALAQQVLGAAPANCEALEIRSDAYGGLQQWERVIETNTRLLAVAEPETWQWAMALCERGLALAEYGS